MNRKIFLFAGLALAIIVGIYLYKTYTGNHSNPSNQYSTKLKSVEEYEKENPSEFLRLKGQERSNLFGTKIKYKGVLENLATVVNYKDVVIEITFYSKTKTKFGTAEQTLSDFFPAHKNTAVDFKVDKPEQSDSIGISIKGAKYY